MRRPSPLPPTARPPADERAAGETSEPATGARVAPGAVPVDASRELRAETFEPAPGVTISRPDEALLAPVIPLQAPGETAGGEDEPPIDGESGQGGATPIGVRDVWRAARARRKALRAEVRRFTVRQRRRRMIWIGVAASLLLLVLTTLAAAYSPLFAVEKVRVVGTSLLDAGAVEDALDDQLGTPLPLVDESAVKAALIAFPLVQSYSLEARPPHELVVRIVERLPIGLLETDAGFTLVDAAGVALSTTESPAPGRPLLSIQGGTTSSAFDAVGEVMRALPATIRDQVTAVSASTPDDVTLTLGGTDTQVIWGSADESAMKALVLEKVMQSRPPESVTAYDVSSPRAVVVR
ncbi:FtsQ-type POTRA domain-containing protein [Microbacterium sp. 4R-513]|uniref:FtsQ-type POTRA domain-containing protein n=1 Tax=Microbacterium sp. 4R-513 TaxID=2567934 RepID=UPI0013E156E3|nr:FtsQ-type POTRA domain-containing protein [Microbacterium sp. 4R-513]QIG40895.1 FtsQ-type POTRA domain-containing protein [Microbacterium sp. 4R-513]